MTVEIELDEQTIHLFQRYGSIVNASDGKTYYFLPYWLECSSKGTECFIMHHLGDLPKKLIDAIEKGRIE